MKIFVTMPKVALEADGNYIGQSLLKGKFIHACTKELALRIVEKFNQPDLYQVWLETDLLEAPILFEDKADNKYYYPHIYGLINVSAIIDIQQIDAKTVLEKLNHFQDATYF